MNNGLVFNPFMGFQNYQENNIDLEKLINKLERLEKDIRILENRLNILEKKEKKIEINEEPGDMYMI